MLFIKAIRLISYHLLLTTQITLTQCPHLSPTHTRQTLSCDLCLGKYAVMDLASESGKQKMWHRPLACVMLRSVTMSVLSSDLGWPIRGQDSEALTNERPGLCHYVMMDWWCNRGAGGHLRPVSHIADITIIATTTTSVSNNNINNMWLARKGISGISWISLTIEESEACLSAFREFSLSEEWFLWGSWRVKICQKKRLWAIQIILGLNDQYLLSF